MAVELNFHPRVIWMAQQLARRPEFYWNEMLDYEDKLLIYQSGIELDLVPQKEIDEFRREAARRGDLGLKAQLEVTVNDKMRTLAQ